MGDHKNSAVIILAIIIIFVWVNINHNNVIWNYIDKGVYWLQEYFYKAENPECVGFPKACLPVYKQCEPEDPCSKTCSPTQSGQVININCSNGQADINKCSPSASCDTLCQNNTCVVFGCYKYCIDLLPNLINKFKLDSSGNVIAGSQEPNTHSLGILKKISVISNQIVVEDSFSTQHTATINPTTGELTF